MALTRSDFKNIPSSGIIPTDRVPASEFAISYAFTYTTTASSDTFNKSFDTHIKIQVLDSGGVVKYVLDIYESYTVLVFGLAPGLTLYTWNNVPSAEKIVGVKADGSPMSTLGLATFGVDPAEGSGTSNRDVIVDSRFYSEIFTEPLDVGDRFKIVFHNASAGFVTDKASLSLATLGEPSLPALFDPRCGQHFHIITDGGLTRILRSRHDQGFVFQNRAEWGRLGPQEPGIVVSGSLKGAAISQGSGGELLVFGQDGITYKILRSFGEGEEWEQIMAIQNSVNPLSVALSLDGSTYFIYGLGSDNKPAYSIFKNQSDGWKLTETGACTGDGLPTSRVNSLRVIDGGGLRLLSTSSSKDLLLFTSEDGKAYTQEIIT